MRWGLFLTTGLRFPGRSAVYMSSLFGLPGMPGSGFRGPGGVAALTTFVLWPPFVCPVGERLAWMARKTTASASRSVAVRLDARKVIRLPVNARTKVGVLRHPTIFLHE